MVAMFKRSSIRVPIVLAALFAACAASVEAQSVPVLASNTWSQYTTISLIRQNQTTGDDETYLTLAGVTCTGGQEFYLEASAPAHPHMVQVALTSFLSSRQIRIKHTGCRIYNMQLR